MKVPRLVALADADALRTAGIPFSQAYLRQKKCAGWHPRLFVSFGRRVFIDLDVYEKEILAPALAERDANAERIERSQRRTA